MEEMNSTMLAEKLVNALTVLALAPVVIGMLVVGYSAAYLAPVAGVVLIAQGMTVLGVCALGIGAIAYLGLVRGSGVLPSLGQIAERFA